MTASRGPLTCSTFWPSHRHVSFGLGDSSSTIEAFGSNGEGVATRGLRLGTDGAGGRLDLPGSTSPRSWRPVSPIRASTARSAAAVVVVVVVATWAVVVVEEVGVSLARYWLLHDKRILKQGLTGEDVREAQSMLIVSARRTVAPGPAADAELRRSDSVAAVAWFQQKVLNVRRAAAPACGSPARSVR